jgi:outer membrane protein assembly factor BamB
MTFRKDSKALALSVWAALPIAAFIGLSGPATARTTIDWPTFAGSAQRTGYNAAETILSTSTVPQLKLHWRVEAGSVFAHNMFQPSLIRQVETPTGTFDLLVMTLSGGAVRALDAVSGNVVWSTAIAPTQITCSDGTSAAVGIGEPATIDVDHALVYVVDAGGLLHALALASGIEISGYPVEVIDAPNLAAGTYVHYASPTHVGSNLYIATAAFCELRDMPYHGQVIQFATATGTVVNRYYPLGNGSVLGGGFWGTGGVAADPDGSYLWGATANSLPPPQNVGNAEKVVQLDTNLNQIAVDGPVLNPSGDLDFGSTPLLFQPTGCPPMLAAMNKTGLLLIYNRNSLNSGATQTLSISKGGGSGKFIGMAAFDPVTNAIYVGNPVDSADGTYLHGLIALQANAACQLTLLWQQMFGDEGMPNPSVPAMIANGVVYYSEGFSSQLAAFDAATGAPLWNSGTLKGVTMGPPLVVNGQVFVQAGKWVYSYGLGRK